MNPYLEQKDIWTDFHDRFIPAIAESLAAQVDPNYIVKIQEQLYIRDIDVERISRLEVWHRSQSELVTVIELLSPTNKYAGPDREQYLNKRPHLLASRVHFVEIDLLRGGPRMPIDDLPECDYCVLVSRRQARPMADLCAVRLSNRLPVIPVPLRAPDKDAQLDLQELLHRVYDAARYQTYIYDGTPYPALSPQEATWAQQFLPART
jgi:hypothetical protein